MPVSRYIHDNDPYATPNVSYSLTLLSTNISVEWNIPRHCEMFHCLMVICPLCKYLMTVIMINSSSPGPNGRHFADGIFKCIILNKKVRCLTEISLKLVPSGPIDNNPALI